METKIGHWILPPDASQTTRKEYELARERILRMTPGEEIIIHENEAAYVDYIAAQFAESHPQGPSCQCVGSTFYTPDLPFFMQQQG